MAGCSAVRANPLQHSTPNEKEWKVKKTTRNLIFGVFSALTAAASGLGMAQQVTGEGATFTMGATPFQIIRKVLINEARAGLVSSLTILTISFLSYSAVAGVVGGGGIGDLAIRYGYYRFQTDVMLAMVALLVVLVQLIQWLGARLAKALDKR